MTLQNVLNELKALADPRIIPEKEKQFGVKTENALGIYQKDLKALIKSIGKDSKLAVELYRTGIYEAKLLSAKIFDPHDMNENLAEILRKDFSNWELCDAFCMNVFVKTEFALQFILEWTSLEGEYEKRAGFTIMAVYCLTDKLSENDLFESFFPIIVRESEDERFYVKKAVNWALRNIGKRNVDLNKKAQNIAEKLLLKNHPVSTWIAKDALRELKSERVNILNYPRKIYSAN